MGKVTTLKEMVRISRDLKADGQRVVTTNGCYDIMHAGHLALLNEADVRGDVLMVGVNSDASVSRLKGDTRPIMGQQDRASMVSALEMVDYAFIFDEKTPGKFLRRLRPDVHVKSRSGYKGIEGPIIRKWGGELVLIDDVPGYSTTDIMAKCFRSYYHEEFRNKWD